MSEDPSDADLRLYLVQHFSINDHTLQSALIRAARRKVQSGERV